MASLIRVAARQTPVVRLAARLLGIRHLLYRASNPQRYVVASRYSRLRVIALASV